MYLLIFRLYWHLICMNQEMKWFFTIALLIIVAIGVGCGRRVQSKPTLTLFVAASLTDVITEIGQAYEQETGIAMVYNFAGSGALAQQLLAAPRADLFLSASERWMDAVESDGKLRKGSRRTFVGNRLVVIANMKSNYKFSDSHDFSNIPFQFLSMGDPAFVPAGRYARSWLRSIRSSNGDNTWDEVAPRISPTPDVRATLMQVEGSRDVIGIVYETDFMFRKDHIRKLYEVPMNETPAISYSVGILNTSKMPHVAEDFLLFLDRPEIMNLLEKYGFILLNKKSD